MEKKYNPRKEYKIGDIVKFKDGTKAEVVENLDCDICVIGALGCNTTRYCDAVYRSDHKNTAYKELP